MENFQSFNASLLDHAGLNRHAVFNLAALPADVLAAIRASCVAADSYRQLILIGHAGRKLWEAVCASGIDSNDPIDDFTIKTTRHWFAQTNPQTAYEILYPGANHIGLQRLGQLAGWHRAAPFKVGIDREWGTWFAYRAVVLADTGFEPTRPIAGESPCDSCEGRVCIAHCPAGALDGAEFDFTRCAAYRMATDSHCKESCLARVSCPVGSSHRYCDAQIRHSYSRSLQAIKRYFGSQSSVPDRIQKAAS